LRARSVCCREMGWAVVIQGQVFAVSAKKFVGPVEVMSARLCSASLSMYSTNARGGEESRSVQPGSGLVDAKWKGSGHGEPAYVSDVWHVIPGL